MSSWILGLALFLISETTAQAGALVSLSPKISASTFTGTDATSGAQINLASNLDIGGELIWRQSFSGWGTLVRLSTRDQGFDAPSGVTVQNVNQMTSYAGVGVSSLLGKALIVTFEGRYSQFLTISVPTSTTVILSKSAFPSFGVQVDLTFLRINRFFSKLEIDTHLILPASAVGSMGNNSDLNACLSFGLESPIWGHDVKEFSQRSTWILDLKGYYQQINIGTTLLNQMTTTLGVEVGVGIRFGKI